MKKLSLFALAAAGLFVGACSSDDAVNEAAQNAQDFTDGAFIGISLQLPGQNTATRANEDFADGDDVEFKVNNATLYIFKGADEATATYSDSYVLGTDYQKDNGGTPDNITSTYTNATLIDNALAEEIRKSDASVNYYAYVVLNHNGQIPSLTKGSSTFADFSKTAFNVIGADIAAECNVWESGLLMTSSPVASKAGGSAAPADDTEYTTLVKLTKANIFGSAAEALQKPAACIYVERAAVKIEVADGRPAEGKKIGTLDVTINGWQIINYEEKYYNTRQIEADWGAMTTDATVNPATNQYRFVSVAKFNPQLPTPDNHFAAYRTYFAKDMHYDKSNVTTLQKPQANVAGPWIALDKKGYTTENTFDVENQTWKNTTQVTFKVTIGDGTTGFYTINKEQDVLTEEQVKTKLASYVFNEPDVTSAINTIIGVVSAKPANANKTVKGNIVVTFTAPTAGKVGFEYAAAANVTIDGTAMTEAEMNAAQDATAKEYDAVKAAINAAVANYKPNFYAGGVAYYNARIQHFGEVETPWSATGTYVSGSGTNVEEIYGYNAAGATQATNRFLGRYGVVRDNWYKLTVDQIGKIGSAEPVDVSTTTPDTPDDEIENYIAVHVHIAPWVLRNQSVKF